MAVQAKVKQVQKTKKSAIERKPVKESEVKSLSSISVKDGVKEKKLPQKKNEKKKALPPTVTKEKILVAVDVESNGTAAISKYAGLFFILIGACASSLALSGIYVDGINLSYQNNTSHFSKHVTLKGVETSSSLSASVSNSSLSGTLDILSADAHIQIASSTDQSKGTNIRVTAPSAKTVSLYVKSSSLLTERFVESMHNSTSTTWISSVSVDAIPNGNYDMFARVETDFGSYDTHTVPLTISRIIATGTVSEDVRVSDAIITSKISEAASEFDTREPRKKITDASVILFPATATASTTSATTTKNTVRTDATKRLALFDSELEKWLTTLGVAIRGGDTGMVARVKSSLLVARDSAKGDISALLTSSTEKGISDSLPTFSENVDTIVNDNIAREEKRQSFIMEKVGSNSFNDSDQDGISDYDERTLYHTNEHSADTDMDGYNDGAELFTGRDPLNAKPEALVKYVSPKTEGNAQSSKVTVSTFESVDATDSTPTQNVLSGQGYPNSFVTLFLYSNQESAWARTDENGKWSFDITPLNLEVGSHEAYAVLLDNSGNILAESKPFSFVKTPTGFTSFKAFKLATQDVVANVTPFSDNLLMLIYALIVTLLGLILMMIGAYLTHHELPSKASVKTV